MMNYFTIESGIPLPVKPKHRRSNTRTPIAHYTYMNIGDSVLFPTYGQAKSVCNLLHSEGYKAKMRTIVHNEAYRVWRVE